MSDPVQLFAPSQPSGPVEEDIGPSFVQTARAVAAICATRMLLMIAVLTGAVFWLWTAYDPTRDRLMAAVAFSLVFVIPQTILYWRKG